MKKKIEYSFDDVPVSKFCYDIDNNKIEVHLKGYYDLVNDEYIDNPCVWMIENWEYAKSRIGDKLKRHDLNKHFVDFSLVLYILYIRYNIDQEFEMLVNTIDNKYFTLYFKDPELSLR